MKDFDDEVAVVIRHLLADNGYGVRGAYGLADSGPTMEQYEITINAVGRVVVLPPYVALYPINCRENRDRWQICCLDLSDPDCFDTLLSEVKKEQERAAGGRLPEDSGRGVRESA